jgi:hypothetical protein
MLQYLNTDLDLTGENLQILDKAFQNAGLVALGTIPPEIVFTAMGYETEHQYQEPEPNIEAFLTIIEALKGELLEIWNDCQKREFNIGYSCGIEPRKLKHGLSPALLKRIAEVNASILITLYETERR